MTFELAYQRTRYNATLICHGFVTPQINDAICAAGWQVVGWWSIDGQASQYRQQAGSGLCGLSTPEEGKRNIAVLRAALKQFGVSLPRARRLTLQEML